MTARSGRTLIIKQGGTTIAGIKEKSMSVSAEAIDITSDDDSGFRTFLNDAGVRMIDLSFSGITKDEALMALLLAESSTTFILTDITIEFEGAVSTDIIAGNFFFGNLDWSGSTADAVSFTGTLQSSGAWTYTVGS